MRAWLAALRGWPFVALFSVTVAGLSTVQSCRLGAHLRDTRAGLARAESDARQLQRAVQQHQEQAAELLGARLVWVAGLEAVAGGLPALASAGPRLLVYVHQDSCDVCVRGELRFAEELHARAPGAVIGVFAGRDRRYPAALARVNGVTFPTYLDVTNEFAARNGLRVSPLSLVLDTSGTVVASHVPIPGQAWFSQAFHGAGLRLLLPGSAAPRPEVQRAR